MPSYRVPEVHVERRPRAAPAPLVRTDVVAFLGLEPRVRPGSAAFHVDVARFEIELAGRRAVVEGVTGLDLLAGGASPIVDDEAIVFALIAARGTSGAIERVVVRGQVAAIGRAVAPTDAQVTIAGPWLRLVDVLAVRTAGAVSLTVRPRLGPTRCDDWRDYVARLGEPADDGLVLGPAVRAFFANGGSRAWIVTVTRPPLTDVAGLAASLDELVGVSGSSEADATGLERALLVAEVSVIDAPDLHARRTDVVVDPPIVLPRDQEAGFIACSGVLGGVEIAARTRVVSDPIFSSAQVTSTQQRMVLRCAPARWRVLLLCSPPLERDPIDGAWRTPGDLTVETWAGQLAVAVDDLERSCVAVYAPWVRAQERVDAPVLELPPTPFVAGVIARRDLARGPHIAPANEPLRGVVALTDAISDERFGPLYDEPPFVNLLRVVPGAGIRVWGARTLSSDRWLRWVSVRRCLSAIERRMLAALEPLAFEPNTPMLWLQVTQIALGVLVPLFQSGALRGDTAEEAFYVRCGPSNNPPELVQAGRLVCEVGVAIAAPAEHIVFRVGRKEGVMEVLE